VVLDLKMDVYEALAREVKSMGLLESSAVERMLHEELKRRRVTQLFEAADKLSTQAAAPLTEAEVEAEIQSARRGRP
jgi:hypothetical protein